MKKLCRLWSVALVALVVCQPVSLLGAAADDMEYLGYSKELREFVTEQVKKTHAQPKSGAAPLGMAPETGPIDEADAVQEQLTELGRSRSLTPESELAAEQSKARLDEFWTRMGIQPTRDAVTLNDEQKAFLKNRIKTQLEGVGYQVKQVDLIDVPANLGIPQVRGVVRVVRPLTTKNGYREIQNNLAQVKDLCLKAASDDGTQYLCELTTFIAENPKNNYYYEKTILNP